VVPGRSATSSVPLPTRTGDHAELITGVRPGREAAPQVTGDLGGRWRLITGVRPGREAAPQVTGDLGGRWRLITGVRPGREVALRVTGDLAAMITGERVGGAGRTCVGARSLKGERAPA